MYWFPDWQKEMMEQAAKSPAYSPSAAPLSSSSENILALLEAASAPFRKPHSDEIKTDWDPDETSIVILIGGEEDLPGPDDVVN